MICTKSCLTGICTTTDHIYHFHSPFFFFLLSKQNSVQYIFLSGEKFNKLTFLKTIDVDKFKKNAPFQKLLKKGLLYILFKLSY